jgi:1,2-dihydroxy-3-keto-5-methylthiopentene dioxygenase
VSEISVYHDETPDQAISKSRDPQKIATMLGEIGIRFEQWETSDDIRPGDPHDVILDAYREDIARLVGSEGYQAVDVVSLSADHPDRDALRQKFLSEHIHAEDEVRFFVAGEGLFSMHVIDQVFEVYCTQGDLISIPAHIRHWFDMGPRPNFVAIRFFNNPEGWVARFTGDDIADRFNRLENDKAEP